VKIKVTTTASDAPSPFVTQHTSDVIGVLSGFDRLRLMATLRPLYQPSLMGRYLIRVGVLLKDFAAFAAGWTERVRTAAHQLAEQTGRPLTCLQGGAQRKELLAQDQARRDGLTQGLIGIWSAVEPGLTYFVRRDRAQKKLVLRLEPGKCPHFYFYLGISLEYSANVIILKAPITLRYLLLDVRQDWLKSFRIGERNAVRA